MTPTILATLALTGAGLAYAAGCWVLPFATCRRCKGAGVRPGLLTRRMRPCRRCRSSGRRLRHGRRAYNYLSRLHHAAPRETR